MSLFSLHHNFSFLKATMKIQQRWYSKTLTLCCSEVGQQFSRPWDLLTVSVLSSLPACPIIFNTWTVSDSKLPMPEYSVHNHRGLQTDMAQPQREGSGILPPEKLPLQKPTRFPHIPAWKRMEHILWFPSSHLEGLGEKLQLCFWEKT